MNDSAKIGCSSLSTQTFSKRHMRLNQHTTKKPLKDMKTHSNKFSIDAEDFFPCQLLIFRPSSSFIIALRLLSSYLGTFLYQVQQYQPDDTHLQKGEVHYQEINVTINTCPHYQSFDQLPSVEAGLDDIGPTEQRVPLVHLGTVDLISHCFWTF